MRAHDRFDGNGTKTGRRLTGSSRAGAGHGKPGPYSVILPYSTVRCRALAPGCASESVHAGMDAFENAREHAESGHDASKWPRRVCM
jgi:hypothetical protein